MSNTAIKIITKSPYHPETAEEILSAVPVAEDEFAALRSSGVEYLRARGLPTPKLEGWKFTNLIPLVRDYATATELNFLIRPVPGVGLESLMDAAQDQWVADLLNADIPGRDPNTDPAMMHLANAFLRDGVVIDVAAGVEVAEPLLVDAIMAEEKFASAHVIIRLGANARLTVIEDHNDAGGGAFWKNIVTRIILGDGAKLTHVRIQEDPDNVVYTQVTDAALGKDAVYDAVTLTTGAALSRNQVHVSLKAPGASCHINGVALMRGAQHADTTILIEHLAPHCESKQNMRHVLDGQAHGVFQGKIHVHQPAQKTDGYQLSRALILSEGAEMDTKPELEIYADDVKCSHGSTTGQLDEEPLFYLQSRGIERDAAKALLIQSFIADGLGLGGDEDWHGMLDERIAAWLA